MTRKKNTGTEQTAENTVQVVQEQEESKNTDLQENDTQTGENLAQDANQDVPEQEGKKDADGDVPEQEETGDTAPNGETGDPGEVQRSGFDGEKRKDEAGGYPAESRMEQSGVPSDKERDIFANIPNPCVYCGPTVRGVARQYTTYQGGIPNELREFIKAHPAARGLLVSTEKFAGVRKRLDTPGTAEAVLFKKVKSQL